MNPKLFASVTVLWVLSVDVSYGLMEIDMGSNRYPFDRELYEAVLDPELCQRQLAHITKDPLLFARCKILVFIIILQLL